MLLLGGELRMVERRTERRKTNTGDEDEEREADLAAPGFPFPPDARYRRKTPSPSPIYVWIMDYLIYIHIYASPTRSYWLCTYLYNSNSYVRTTRNQEPPPPAANVYFTLYMLHHTQRLLRVRAIPDIIFERSPSQTYTSLISPKSFLTQGS